MENQYTYYEYQQNQDGEQPGGENLHTPPKKPRKSTPKWMKTVGLAVVFGVVASFVFQAGNVLGEQVLGTLTGEQKTAKTTATVNEAQLTKSSDSTVTSDVAEITKNVMPSVVSITNMSVQQVQNFFGGVQEQQSESVGSGIIIGQNDKELLIATNNHVVEGNDTLTVSFIDEKSVEANIKGTDANRDLAVVAVSLENISESTMDEIAVATLGDSSQLQVGEPAIAIGNALGYGQSVTTGIISATNRTLDGIDGNLIQTDAAINPGNSGGALLNAKGEVIGINTAKVATDAVEGMGYAIPISDAGDIINNLMNQETKTKVAEKDRGYIGISGVDVTSDSAKMYNMPTGVYISEVQKNGGADEAGLTKGMVITGINGSSVDGMTALQEQLQYYEKGETVTLTVQTPTKEGEYEESQVEVTLGSSSK